VSSVEGSLTDATYKELSQHYREQKGTGGMKSVFDRLETALGKYSVDRKFARRYDEFIIALKSSGRAVNTVSNYSSVVQRVLNFAFEHLMIDVMPIRSFEIVRTFRDRVWRGDERIRFWNTANQFDSHLTWATRFSERRPIREDDLAHLTDVNLVLVGPNAPYIRFRPKKTSRRKPRDTYLPLLDKRTGKPFDQELFDYLVNGRPSGCPYLFPRIGTERNGRTSKLKPGRWKFLGDPDRHWKYLLAKAGISDFHFHDLKHVAITNMIKVEGWTRDELKDLGIQYSDRAIDVYLNLDAEDALGMVNRSSSVAVPGAERKTAVA
jgi:hypothetical protein